jgi:hypothetical protein
MRALARETMSLRYRQSGESAPTDLGSRKGVVERPARNNVRANLPSECQPIARSHGSLGMNAVQTPARGTRIPR